MDRRGGRALAVGKAQFRGRGRALLIANAVVNRYCRPYWLALLAALVAPIALYAVYLRGNLSGYMGDIAMLAGVHKSGSILQTIASITRSCLPELALPAAIVLLHLRRTACRDIAAPPRSWLGRRAIVLLVFVLGPVVTSANAQFFDIPLWVVAGTILAQLLCGRPTVGCGAGVLPTAPEGGFPVGMAAAAGTAAPPAEPSAACRFATTISFAAAGLAALGCLVPDFYSVPFVLRWKHFYAELLPADARVDTPSMRAMWLPPKTTDPERISLVRRDVLSGSDRADYSESYPYAFYVNDGLQLLRKHIDAHSRVYCLDACNPFPFALGMAGPRGAGRLARGASDGRKAPSARRIHVSRHNARHGSQAIHLPQAWDLYLEDLRAIR